MTKYEKNVFLVHDEVKRFLNYYSLDIFVVLLFLQHTFFINITKKVYVVFQQGMKLNKMHAADFKVFLNDTEQKKYIGICLSQCIIRTFFPPI